MSVAWPDGIDHLIYGVPDLAAGVADLRERTGLTAVAGGRHEGRGTANALLGLGPSCYLEIIGPDPDADTAPGWFGLAGLRTPRLLTWALRTDDLDRSVRTAREAGCDPGPGFAMSRRTAAGDLLRWRLTAETVARSGGVVPFLIDWGDTPHPARRDDPDWPRLEPVRLTVCSPNPDETTVTLGRLGVRLDVEPADRPGVRCEVDSPAGRLILQ